MIRSDLTAYYSRRVSEYEAIYRRPERQGDLATLRRWVRGQLAGHRVLEIACGTGYWTQWIAPAVRTVVATDASPDTLDAARHKTYPPGRVSFAVADAYALDAVPGSVSAALAAFWFSHVPVERRDTFLEALHRRLGAGGRVVMMDNRYVEGSSTAISRRDEAGNTYQQRALSDGSRWEILKNFPTRAEMEALVEPAGVSAPLIELEYFWAVSYDVRAIPGAQDDHPSAGVSRP